MQDEVEMRTEELARWTVERSKSLGADCASAEVSHDKGLSVTVRMGEVDAVEHTEERVLTLSAWIGRRKGCASTSDFSERSLEAAVQDRRRHRPRLGGGPCCGASRGGGSAGRHA